MVARILAVSLTVAGLGAGLGYALLGNHPTWPALSVLLGCVGAVVGVIAGAAKEAIEALREKKGDRAVEL